jgi:hypothetical protein
VARFFGLSGMILAGLVAVLFLADLVAGVPFGRKSLPAEVGFLLASLLLAYLSWSILDRGRRR